MGGLLAAVRRSDPDEPLTRCNRLRFLLMRHWRGLIGCLGPIVLMKYAMERKPASRCFYVWACMAWYWVLQPVPAMVTGIVPIFAFPMLGIMNTYDTCKCYLTDASIMLIMAGMLMTIMNFTKLDKRIAIWMLTVAKPSHAGLLFAVCLSSMLLSMVGLRVLVMAMMMPILDELMKKMYSVGQEAPYSAHETAPGVTQEYANDMSSIYYMAAGTSSAIGSMGLLSSSYATITFIAAMDKRYPKLPEEYSYMKMAMFLLPTMLVMMLINYFYLALLLLAPGQNRRKLEESARKSISQFLTEQHKALGGWTYHQAVVLFWMLMLVVTLMLREPCGFKGWAKKVNGESRYVSDATVFGLFVLVLHSLPANLKMLKYLKYNRRSQLPPVAPSPGILDMGYANTNTPWGYLLMIGGAAALIEGSSTTGLHEEFKQWMSKAIEPMPWWTALMLILIFTTFVSNTTGFTVPCAMLMPIFVEIGAVMKVCPLIPPLALALPASLNFTLPFRDTPPSAVQNQGRVRTKRLMAVGAVSCAICAAVLYASLYFYAPALWTCAAGAGPCCSTDRAVWDARAAASPASPAAGPGDGGDKPSDDGGDPPAGDPGEGGDEGGD